MVDLRVDLHPEPVAGLRRLADAYFPLVPYYNLRPRDPNVPSAAEWLAQQRRGDKPRRISDPLEERWTTWITRSCTSRSLRTTPSGRRSSTGSSSDGTSRNGLPVGPASTGWFRPSRWTRRASLSVPA